MAADREQSPFVKFGPLIFLGLGVVLAGVIVFMGMGGDFSTNVQNANQTINRIQRELAQTEVDREATQNDLLYTLRMPEATEPPRDAKLIRHGLSVDYGIRFRAPDAIGGGGGPVTPPPPPLPPPTQKDTLMLIAPHALGAVADDLRKAIFVQWNARGRKSSEKAPEDIAYMLFRTTPDDEGKPDLYRIEPLLKQPTKEMRFVDTTALAEQEYFYGAVQLTKNDTVTEGVSDKLTNLLGKMKDYKDMFVAYRFSEATFASEAVALAAPDETEWYYDSLKKISGQPAITAHFRRWELTKHKKTKEPLWLRITVKLTDIPSGSVFGGQFTINEMKKGNVAPGGVSIACELALEYFDGTQFVKLVVDDKKDEIADTVDGSFLRKGLDFNTGMIWNQEDRANGKLVFLGNAKSLVYDKKEKEWADGPSLDAEPTVELDAPPVVEEEPRPGDADDGDTDPDQ